MKEDYLWDKTGGDAEIERLENALKAFRYQTSAPPALPAKVVPFEKKSWRGFFRLSLACSALAALTIICFGVWFQSSKKTIETAKDSPTTAAPTTNQNSSQTVEIEVPNLQARRTEKIETPKRAIEPQIVTVKKIVPQNINRKNLTARNFAIKPRRESNVPKLETPKPAIKLTEEETYAYNRLLLALSITGSQLKIVKDKIDAVENSR